MQRAKEFPFVARLPFGLSLLPIDDEWVHAEDERDPHAGLELPPRERDSGLWMENVVAKLGVAHCTHERLLFVRTDWFGGIGESQGWLFESGRTIQTIEVNRGLAALGVQ